jgi:hypothetical protein
VRGHFVRLVGWLERRLVCCAGCALSSLGAQSLPTSFGRLRRGGGTAVCKVRKAVMFLTSALTAGHGMGIELVPAQAR